MTAHPVKDVATFSTHLTQMMTALAESEIEAAHHTQKINEANEANNDQNNNNDNQ